MNNDLANEIRTKVDIVDIIGEKIPLVPKGKNFFGVCPFHDDTNPSMSVSREKQIYRCFSCGASGNVFTFLMNYEHKEFREVLRDLGNRLGINTSSIKLPKNDHKYEKLYEAYNLSVKYFQNNLASTIGKEARNYLLRRKIDEDIIKEFKIGLSLDSNDDLTKLLLKKDYNYKTLNEIGLSIDNRDIYKDRIMFPLHDPYGHIVGFSGRIYKEIDQNKYLNTKETIIFKKGHCLYNYHIAKDISRSSKRIIIMEGFMDVIRASTIGIKDVVALMGTALTKEQISLIKRLSNNIILCLDGDSPGRKAALNIGEELFRENIEVKVVALPNNDDPDTYILNNGKDKFINMLDKAVSFNDYKINLLKENVNFQNEESLANYINSVLTETAKIDDEIRVEIILKKLAKDYNIEYNTLEKKFKGLKKENKKEEQKIVKPKRVEKRKSKYVMAVEQLIYYMINNEWVIDLVEKENLIFPTNETRLLTSEVVYYYNKYGSIDVADFYTYLQGRDDLLDLFSSIISKEYNDDITKSDLFSYFKVIREYSVNEQIKILKNKIKETTDEMEQAKLSEEIRKLKLGE